ncbi:hypothetical protein SNEBB_010091 [Seison nebaliae]|nr:hypothetical protein SNEBB_010091 [Seison nebaliae]
MKNVFVSASKVYERLNKNIAIFDCSYPKPTEAHKRNTFKEFIDQHIPSANFFDIDGVVNKEINFPHSLSDGKTLQTFLAKNNVDNLNKEIILYDNDEMFGLFSAPRVWFNLWISGFRNVWIMEGGFREWKSNNLPVENGINSTNISNEWNDEPLQIDENKLINKELIEKLVKNGKLNMLDARPANRFNGVDHEPRDDCPSGHIEGAINLPFYNVLDKSKGILKNETELKDLVNKNGIKLNEQIEIMCGSGLSACIVILALYSLNITNVRLYDNSWLEWSRESDVRNLIQNFKECRSKIKSNGE